MAIKSGFFNSRIIENENGTTSYDREYYADDFANYLIKVVGNGVFANPSNNLQIVASEGMNVIVKSGEGRINGYWIINDTDYELTLEPADVILDRIDRIVMQLDINERVINIVYKTGTAASNPVAPTLIRNEYIQEYSLARILVSKGATIITQASITDTRPLEDECGLIATLGKMETDNYFIQMQSNIDFYQEQQSLRIEAWNETFNTWFDAIKDSVKATSLYREYSALYSTTTENEYDIPIPENVHYVNDGLDVMNVLVNGIKLVEGVDYEINENYITMFNFIPVVGTPIEIINKKSVSDTPNDSLVSRVETLEQKTSYDHTYYATGTNDTTTITTMALNFLNGLGEYANVADNANLKIAINGVLGVGSLYDDQSYFSINSTTSSNRRVILDFANATIPIPVSASQGILAIFDIGDNVIIENANVEINDYNTPYIYGFHGGIVRKCNLIINNTSATTVYGVYSAKEVSNSEIEIANVNSYGIYSCDRVQFNNVKVSGTYSIQATEKQLVIGNICNKEISNSNATLYANIIDTNM